MTESLFTESSNTPLKKLSNLQGSPVMSGDHTIATHYLFVGIGTTGTTTIQNFPWSLEKESLLETFLQLDLAHWSRSENTLRLEGQGKAPKVSESAIIPKNEMELIAWSSLLAAHQSVNIIQVDVSIIPRSTVQWLLQTFECQLKSNHEDTVYTYSIQALKGSHSFQKKSQEYFSKLAKLYFHYFSGKGVQIEGSDLGPDHLERVLEQFSIGVDYKQPSLEEMSELERRMARLKKKQEKPTQTVTLPEEYTSVPPQVTLPNDITAASVYTLAATLTPGSDILLPEVNLNASRSGFLSALRRMGANIETSKKKERSGEPIGQLRVRTAPLKARRFDFDSLKNMKEEVPLLIIAAAFAQGETIFRDIAFLRHMEPDNLKSMIQTLKKIQGETGEIEDGLILRGQTEWEGQKFDVTNNAFIALAYLVLGLHTHSPSQISDSKSIENLFPGLLESLQSLSTGNK